MPYPRTVKDQSRGEFPGEQPEVSLVAAQGGVSATDLLLITTKALGFFIGAVLVARTLLPKIVNLTSLSKHSSFWTCFSLCLALTGAQLAALAGLAPLIGAFPGGRSLQGTRRHGGQGSAV